MNRVKTNVVISIFWVCFGFLSDISKKAHRLAVFKGVALGVWGKLFGKIGYFG